MAAKKKTAAKELKAIANMTRVEIVDEMKAGGWDGATSYGKPQLEGMLELIRAGKIDKIARPKRGRPPMDKTAAA